MAMPKNKSNTTAEQTLLNVWLSAETKPLRSALGFALCSVILLIAQMWCLSLVADDLIKQKTPQALEVFVFFGCWLFRILCAEFRQYQAQQASLRVRNFIRQSVLTKLIVAGPLRHEFGSDGELTALVLEKIEALDGYISRYWVQQYVVVFAPLLISLAVATQSLLAAAIMLLTAPIVIVFMILVGKEATEANREQLARLTLMGGRFFDFILGLSTLRHFKATHIAEEQLLTAAENYKKSSFSVLKMAFLSTAVLELFSSLAIALVALYLGLGLIGELPWLKQQVAVDYQAAIFILLLAPEFYAPLRQLGSDYHAKAHAIAATNSLMPLWQAPSKAPIQGTEIYDWQPGSQLFCQNIAVFHQDKIRLALKDFRVKYQEQWLITGDSGSGKSTLLQLLCGFWPWQGEIRLGDLALTEVALEHWRSQLGYLHQKPEFLPGTIAENLKAGNSDIQDDAIWQAIQAVGLLEFVRQLPNQLNYRLIDNAANLSGGQQQRLALARLILAKKRIWLLDEPWVHLDAENMMAMIALVKANCLDKTLLLVSHQTQGLEWIPNHLCITSAEKVPVSLDLTFSSQERAVNHA